MAKSATAAARPFDIRGATKGLATTMREAQAGEKIVELPIKTVQPDPNQPRKKFEQASIAALAEQMKVDGQLSPVIVRPVDDPKAPYRLVFGERRWRALQVAGSKTIKAVVRQISPDEAGVILRAQLAENMQREDMTLVEKVNGVIQLVTLTSTAEAAVTIGEPKSYVSKVTTIAKAGGPVAQVLEAEQIEDVEALYLLAKLAERDKPAAWRLANAWNDPEKRANARRQVKAQLERLDGAEDDEADGKGSKTAAPSRGQDRDDKGRSGGAARGGSDADDQVPVSRSRSQEDPRSARVARGNAQPPDDSPADLEPTILKATKADFRKSHIVIHTQRGPIMFDRASLMDVLDKGK